MEENTLVVENVAEETPVADTPAAASEVVDAIDLLGENTAAEDVAAEDAATEAVTQTTPAKTYNQQDFDNAVRRKMEYATRDMQSRMERDPYFQTGKRLAALYATTDGVDPTAALQRVMAENYERQVEQLAGDPSLMARMFLASNTPQAPAQPEGEVQNTARNIAKDIAEGVRAGELPGDFNLDEYVSLYPDFIPDCVKYGAKAAARTVQALKEVQKREQQVLAKVAQAQALPKPTRPAYARAEDGQIDYTKLTDAEFDRVKNRMHELYMQGKTVRIN